MRKNFYRIQAAHNDKGPYTNGDVPFWANHDDDDHPSPVDEGVWENRWSHRDEVCGFKSMKQFWAWFDHKVVAAIADSTNVYYIQHYTVPEKHIKVGKRQAVARQDKLKLVSSDLLRTLVDKAPAKV